MKNIIIKDILISQMSFPLKYKNEKEIWWENEFGHPFTIEIIDIENEQYAVRIYYDNGQLWRKDNYHQGQKHGECLEWRENGQLCSKVNYCQGQLHGECAWLRKNGKSIYEKEYNHGELIGEEYYY